MWPRWVPTLAGSVALISALGLGTLGWFVNAFGIGSDCTDKYSCGSGSCGPCATAHAWVWAGGMGEWVLLATAAAILVLGKRLPQWRRTITIAAVAVMLVAVGWYAATTAIAERSY